MQYITQLERLYRQISKPSPPQSTPAPVTVEPKKIEPTRADVDALIKRQRAGTPEELEAILANAKDLRLTHGERDQLCVDASVAMARRARQGGRREDPAALGHDINRARLGECHVANQSTGDPTLQISSTTKLSVLGRITCDLMAGASGRSKEPRGLGGCQDLLLLRRAGAGIQARSVLPLSCRRIREALHCLGQLCIHFVRNNHDIWQQQVEIQQAEILMQCSKNGYLKDS
jgi:hypothetical protein